MKLKWATEINYLRAFLFLQLLSLSCLSGNESSEESSMFSIKGGLPSPGANLGNITTSEEDNEVDPLILKLCNKQEILAELEKMPIEALWDGFLRNQVDLYFDQEIGLFSEESWWQEAQDVLEIGSGNGEYLSRVALLFENKKYLGIEKKGDFVIASNIRFQDIHLLPSSKVMPKRSMIHLARKYDVVIFRFTLQHLQDPLQALNHAKGYLKPGGCLLLIDVCDSFYKTSHPILYLEEVAKWLDEKNGQQTTGNRLITLQLLKNLKDKENLFAQTFDVLFSNLDETGNGNIESKQMIWQSQKERTLYFNHALYFLEILKKGTWKLPVDSSAAYDELRVFLDDQTFWIRPGVHVMVLRKNE